MLNGRLDLDARSAMASSSTQHDPSCFRLSVIGCPALRCTGVACGVPLDAADLPSADGVPGHVKGSRGGLSVCQPGARTITHLSRLRSSTATPGADARAEVCVGGCARSKSPPASKTSD